MCVLRADRVEHRLRRERSREAEAAREAQPATGALWAGLWLGALLVVFFAPSRAEAATLQRQDGAGTCAVCNGTGVAPEAPWHRLAGRLCRQCGGTGDRQPGCVGRASVVSSDERPAGAIREFG
jgi:hypothetical protein